MKRISILYLLLFSAGRLMAQQANPELKELINRSFNYYPQFNELNQAIQVADDQITLAKANRLPTLDANGSYRYAAPTSQINIPAGNQLFNLKIIPNNSYTTSLNASYVLFDFGIVKANVDKAKVGLQYAKDNVDYNKAQVAYQVAQVFYQIIYLQKSIAIEDSVLNFLNANKHDTEIKLKHGDALRYDVLSIQSNVDKALNIKIDLVNNLNKQYALLDYATGVSQSKGKDFDFFLTQLPDAATALTEAEKQNPDFTMLRDQIEQSKADLGISLKGGKPSLTANAATGFQNGYSPVIDQFRYNYSAGVTLKIPLYAGGKYRKQIRLSQSQLKQKTLSEQTLSNTYLKDIRQALTDIESNRNSLQYAVQQVKDAKEAEKLAQSRYRNGTGTNLELISASSDVQQVLLTQLKYELQLCQANLKLAQLTGVVYW